MSQSGMDDLSYFSAISPKDFTSPLATPTPLCYSRATPEAPDSSGALGLLFPDASAGGKDT
jgi:hypothetical protein